ncbi:MAG TPA: hypothetical protein VEW03_14360, partial [Longimicrobiaceae bacterium]|nr:hypothetical protein [Longimicrobiaceae bacterium]
AVAVLPKCPLCVMLVLGALGVPHGGHDDAFALLQGGAVLGVVCILALRRPGLVPLLLALAGAATMVAGRAWTGSPAPLYIGAVLVAAGWLWSFRSTHLRGGCGCAAGVRAG